MKSRREIDTDIPSSSDSLVMTVPRYQPQDGGALDAPAMRKPRKNSIARVVECRLQLNAP
jgi:hypothetical protein